MAVCRDVCYETEWSNFILVPFVGVLVYPIGVPLMFAIILKRNSHKLNLCEKFPQRYGFLYDRYIPECYYWEICEVFRKSMITITVMFAAPGSVVQYASTLYVSGIFMVLHFAFFPFANNRENVLQVVLALSPNPNPNPTLTLILPEKTSYRLC